MKEAIMEDKKEKHFVYFESDWFALGLTYLKVLGASSITLG